MKQIIVIQITGQYVDKASVKECTKRLQEVVLEELAVQGGVYDLEIKSIKS